MRARAVQTSDAGGVGDEDRIGATDEEAAFDHTDDAPNALLQPRRVGNRIESAIEDAVAAVGDEGLAVGATSRSRTRGAQRLERRPGWLPARMRRPRRGPARACPADRPAWSTSTMMARRRAGGSDDLLAQQRAAQTLDQIERAALHLVGAVDREIDLPMLARKR